MRASVVIAAHNEGELLERTVRSCLEAVPGLDCELIVADDASTDGSVDAVRRRYGRARVVSSEERRGVSPTKDLGARHARGDVIVFLDGHCKPDPGALDRLVADVEEWGGGAVVTPRVAPLDVARWESRRDLVCHGLGMELGSLSARWLGLDDLRPERGPGGRAYYRQPTCIGCCVAMGRGLYETLWGFDPAMRYFGSEDLDLGMKAWLMGYPVLHDPGPVIGHRFQEQFDNYTVPAEHVFVNQLRMARKNFGDATWTDWIGRFEDLSGTPFWKESWAIFLAGSDSLERERSYLHAHRAHDEGWYAAAFGLAWPGAGDRAHPLLDQLRDPAGAVSAGPSSSPSNAPSPQPSPSPTSYPTTQPTPRPKPSPTPSPPPRR